MEDHKTAALGEGLVWIKSYQKLVFENLKLEDLPVG